MCLYIVLHIPVPLLHIQALCAVTISCVSRGLILEFCDVQHCSSLCTAQTCWLWSSSFCELMQRGMPGYCSLITGLRCRTVATWFMFSVTGKKKLSENSSSETTVLTSCLTLLQALNPMDLEEINLVEEWGECSISLNWKTSSSWNKLAGQKEWKTFSAKSWQSCIKQEAKDYKKNWEMTLPLPCLSIFVHRGNNRTLVNILSV